MSTELDYTSKFLNIGQIKARIAELEASFPTGEPEGERFDDAYAEWNELQMLRSVEHDLNWCWAEDNKVLINTNHFDEYAEELMYDIGDCQRGGIVANLVDWAKVSESILQDYKKVILDGNGFYTRA